MIIAQISLSHVPNFFEQIESRASRVDAQSGLRRRFVASHVVTLALASPFCPYCFSLPSPSTPPSPASRFFPPTTPLLGSSFWTAHPRAFTRGWASPVHPRRSAAAGVPHLPGLLPFHVGILIYIPLSQVPYSPYLYIYTVPRHERTQTKLGKFFNTIPDELIPWIQEQKFFWVATAPLSESGHINISPKGVSGTFKIIDNKTFFYQDLTGSGRRAHISVETAAHLRENQRITVLFNAFEGPPQVVRLFGKGEVHELDSPRYNELIPLEERISGSRAAIVVDVHKVGVSRGFSVPLYQHTGERTNLHEISGPLEEADRKFANERKDFEATSSLAHFSFIPSESDPSKDDHTPKGIKDYWSLPAMVYSRKLAGLPPEAVKEDRKSFHQDVFDKDIVHQLGNKGYHIAETIGGAGFLVGVAIGAALSWSWMRVYK
ncbi:Pyridoxamine 5'-phosphate oxidase [Rhizoctonia solani]|uniref:Pyridoxamine 5'-phosphate oxidase n=1 Tax=Rhizoctonia solani TaxID=456999 RepID=A0A8H7LNC1_9AGAM|nr:Pyridoxamine 5'-phosphate oxidase [Rhizoctonia solani]